MGLNSVALQGRLTRAPEIRSTQTGKTVASFSLAVDRDKDHVDFIDVVAWEKRAEFCRNYLNKGSPVVLLGQLTTRTWTDKDGKSRKQVEVLANNIWFAGPKQDGQEDAYAASERAGKSGEDRTVKQSFQDVTPTTNLHGEDDDDGDLPF